MRWGGGGGGGGGATWALARGCWGCDIYENGLRMMDGDQGCVSNDIYRGRSKKMFQG